jgi:eukaryotic-like serine/threonine-protein kinase
MLHADLEALVGSTIHERYRVESLLGVGGMGAVFKAHHVGLGRDVAIKVLHPEFGRDPSVGKRFEREATSASRLDHPNCVRVTDFGTTGSGTSYLVMELLAGTELEIRLGQPWPPQVMIATAKQILAGLEHAHHFGIVHRDLKPANVYLAKDYRDEEVVKLVDFGIAKLLDEQGVEKLTREGVVFGTPRYMSPEQATGGKIDERTDLYAAGLIFYEMLAGSGPFDTKDTAQLLRMQIMAPPPPLPDSVPASLAKVVEKLLEKSKAHRYAQARDVIAALDEVTVMLAAAPVLLPSADASSAANPVGSQVARSGAAWQPASAPPAAANSSGGHRTLEYAGNYVATPTGSHLGVGQLATGQYESLARGAAIAASQSWTDSSASSEPSAGGVSRTVPVVNVETIERRPPPPVRRAWLPWALVGVLAFVGIVAVVSMALIDEAPAEAGKPEPIEQPTPDAPATGGIVPAPPAPGPTRATSPASRTDSRSSSTTPTKKSVDADDGKPSGKSDEPVPIDDANDPPADDKPSNDAIIDPPSDASDPPSGNDPPSDGDKDAAGDAAELAKRERGKGKPKKEKDK